MRVRLTKEALESLRGWANRGHGQTGGELIKEIAPSGRTGERMVRVKFDCNKSTTDIALKFVEPEVENETI